MSSPARSLFDAVPPLAPAPPRQATMPSTEREEHQCAICGAPAGFGFGVFLRRGLEGRWSCITHRDEVEAIA